MFPSHWCRALINSARAESLLFVPLMLSPQSVYSINPFPLSRAWLLTLSGQVSQERSRLSGRFVRAHAALRLCEETQRFWQGRAGRPHKKECAKVFADVHVSQRLECGPMSKVAKFHENCLHET